MGKKVSTVMEILSEQDAKLIPWILKKLAKPIAAPIGKPGVIIFNHRHAIQNFSRVFRIHANVPCQYNMKRGCIDTVTHPNHQQVRFIYLDHGVHRLRGLEFRFSYLYEFQTPFTKEQIAYTRAVTR